MADPDIEMYTPYRSTRTTIRALSSRGERWVIRNMSVRSGSPARLYIATDGRDEVAEEMRAAGLIVKDNAGLPK